MGKGPTEKFACWVVDYRFRNNSNAEIRLNATDVSAHVEAMVSNSSAAGHSSPRKSSLSLIGGATEPAVVDLIEAAEEARKCRELGSIFTWVEQPSGNVEPGSKSRDRYREENPPKLGPIASGEAKLDANVIKVTTVNSSDLIVERGRVLHVQVRLEHKHDLFGAFDPLLGKREIAISIGGFTHVDSAALDRDRKVQPIDDPWGEVPLDRRDSRVFVSAPDCLHLEAHAPGCQSFRFPDRSVRHGARMKLVFWYMIAPGSLGECRAKLAQYRDTPTCWKVLDEGAVEEELRIVGKWVRVERLIKIESEATAVALEFRINGCDIGELWIDDVSLQPIEKATPKGP